MDVKKFDHISCKAIIDDILDQSKASLSLVNSNDQQFSKVSVNVNHEEYGVLKFQLIVEEIKESEWMLLLYLYFGTAYIRRVISILENKNEIQQILKDEKITSDLPLKLQELTRGMFEYSISRLK